MGKLYFLILSQIFVLFSCGTDSAFQRTENSDGAVNQPTTSNPVPQPVDTISSSTQNNVAQSVNTVITDNIAIFPPAVQGSYDNATGLEVVTKVAGSFTLYYPKLLGTGGYKHPILTWGNGTFSNPFLYSGLLQHMASHGFIVIASNSPNTGSGKEMLEGVNLLASENNLHGSEFYQKINPQNVCAFGHSQGGGGTIVVGTNPIIKCIVAIEPWMAVSGGAETARNVRGASFIIAGSNDDVVPEQEVSLVYNNIPRNVVYGIKKGAGHFVPMGSAEGMRGYITAWMRYHLMEDRIAGSIFIDQNCGICRDPSWIINRK